MKTSASSALKRTIMGYIFTVERQVKINSHLAMVSNTIVTSGLIIFIQSKKKIMTMNKRAKYD